MHKPGHPVTMLCCAVRYILKLKPSDSEPDRWASVYSGIIWTDELGKCHITHFKYLYMCTCSLPKMTYYSTDSCKGKHLLLILIVSMFLIVHQLENKWWKNIIYLCLYHYSCYGLCYLNIENDFYHYLYSYLSWCERAFTH